MKVFQAPQHVYTKALISSRPSLDVRLKRLPTIKDFLENTVNKEIITSEERENSTKNYTVKLRFWKSKMWKKNIFLPPDCLEKNRI